MSDLKVDGITAATANTAVTIKGLGTGKVVLGDGSLVFPDADGSANQYIKTDGSANLAFATLPTAGYTETAFQASTSGTAIDFTGIPSGVTSVRVFFNQVSTNGTTIPHVFLGDAGGFETQNYGGYAVEVDASPVKASGANGFIIAGAWSASHALIGVLQIDKADSQTESWYSQGIFSETSAIGAVDISATFRTLSEELTQIRVYAGGSDTFDNGSIGISYL